ncbi:MAG TPA: hypothetical protein VIM12_12445 [Noviherbaspirillum sp.]|uniref:hypothetical protein n=1 Tax=Noviherbaspirillum sp. TaxID=1926288 RepID=UPI002F941EFD
MPAQVEALCARRICGQQQTTIFKDPAMSRKFRFFTMASALGIMLALGACGGGGDDDTAAPAAAGGPRQALRPEAFTTDLLAIQNAAKQPDHRMAMA